MISTVSKAHYDATL